MDNHVNERSPAPLPGGIVRLSPNYDVMVHPEAAEYPLASLVNLLVSCGHFPRLFDHVMEHADGRVRLTTTREAIGLGLVNLVQHGAVVILRTNAVTWVTKEHEAEAEADMAAAKRAHTLACAEQLLRRAEEA